MDTLKLAGVVRESIVDGPGIRYTVFAQGCPHHCPGCHNPHTWSTEGGTETHISEIIGDMRKNPLLKGITLSGGEPFLQAEAMSVLAREAHRLGYDVITYTGFTFEALVEKARTDAGIASLLEATDVLVDGPYVQHLKRYDLKFRGSENQRLIRVRPSLVGGLVMAEF